MIDLATIQYKHFNERDLEYPALIDFIKIHPDINTALDVGAHYSWYTYASDVKKLVPNYDGVDILPDEETKAIVNKYWKMNILDMPNVHYDLVFSISSIEHVGISTYKVNNYQQEQIKVFNKIMDLAKKYVFLTFPFGKEAFHDEEFANITEQQQWNFSKIAYDKRASLKRTFYFSEFPQGKKPWREVDIDFASEVEYKQELGTRCVCFLAIEKM